MNPTAVPWCDFTWNAIVGCAGACPYCFARRIATTRLAHLCEKCGTFEPHLHSERLDQPLHIKKPALIFADSMSDWWSEGVDGSWRGWAIEQMIKAPQHRFVVLTKRPEHIGPDVGGAFGGGYWPSNAWLGVSITSGADWWRWEALSKLPERIHKFISVEPLLCAGIGPTLAEEARRERPLPEWVILGPLDSERNAKNSLRSADLALWQDTIRAACKDGHIPLFEKAGLPLQPLIKQMPPDLASVFRKGGLTP